MLGEGILKGLGETARNFAGSFVSAERLTTVQYPEERAPVIENTRDFPFLVYDGRIGRRACGAWLARFARRSVRRSASIS